MRGRLAYGGFNRTIKRFLCRGDFQRHQRPATAALMF
jgi:hypothetical protein